MKKSFVTKSVLAAGMALAIGGQAANAATATTTFQVTATVANACAVSATDLAFGTYNQTAGTATDNISTVTVNCTTDAAYTVALSAGTGTGATVASRKMASGATNLLSYTLYRDSGRTQLWGVTTGTDTVPGTGNGTGQALTVYGRIFANQSATAPAGSYADTVTATVTF